MAEGLAAGDGKNHLRTFHPTGGQGSAQFFHVEDWLDFNMRQNGHEVEYGNYSKTRDDYNRTPAKPRRIFVVLYIGIYFMGLSGILTVIIRFGKCMTLTNRDLLIIL